MDHPRTGRPSRSPIPVGLSLLALLAPGALLAQEEPDPPEPLPDVVSGYALTRIECFAEIFIQVVEVRDELHQEIARFHDEGRRREARERADERLTAIFEERDVSAETYEEFVLRVALDEELREAFTTVVERLREAGPDEPPDGRPEG